MKIYSTDKDGYINSKKDVGDKCKLGEFDYIGEPPFGVGCHVETGEPKPIPQEVLDTQREQELRKIISDKQLVGDDASIEQAELKSLLEGTHDEYIQNVKEEAQEAQMLELLKGGLI